MEESIKRLALRVYVIKEKVKLRRKYKGERRKLDQVQRRKSKRRGESVRFVVRLLNELNLRCFLVRYFLSPSLMNS